MKAGVMAKINPGGIKGSPRCPEAINITDVEGW